MQVNQGVEALELPLVDPVVDPLVGPVVGALGSGGGWLALGRLLGSRLASGSGLVVVVGVLLVGVLLFVVDVLLLLLLLELLVGEDVPLDELLELTNAGRNVAS